MKPTATAIAEIYNGIDLFIIDTIDLPLTPYSNIIRKVSTGSLPINNKIKELNLKKNIYVEAESSKIGNVHIPKSIWAKMIISPRVEIKADLKLRANFLVKDYDYMCDNPNLIYPLLNGLKKRLSKKLIDSWKDLILKKNWEDLTESFLQNHYDPSYSSNTIKNDRKIIKLINAKSLSHSEISKIAKKILKNN